MAGAGPRASTLRAHAAAALALVAVVLLLTWPLAREAGHQILGATYFWDAYTNAMIMGGRVDAALGRGPLSFYDDYFFAPLPHSIAFNENLFGLSLIFAPFYLASGNPLWAYNLTLLASLSLSMFFTYLLVRRLTGNSYAGVLAGVAFACCPFVMFEVGRIQLVATQWIPACFLFLHRAIEGRRFRDVIGLWVCYLLQIGTCLYYAMFLIPLLALALGVLLWRWRPPRRLYLELAGVGAIAAIVAISMVYPYFTLREDFALERSLAFASGYDGKLEFFSNVHVTNRTLTGMHHTSERGAREEIAFPGFTVLSMCVLALGAPLWRVFVSMREAGTRSIRVSAARLWRWLLVVVVASVLTLLAHSMLVGAFGLALGIWLLGLARRQQSPGEAHPFAGRRGLYFALFGLSVLMFLGLEPLDWRGEPVRGLYYYFHTYFPGFNGIRKVSRQALMTSFCLVVFSSFGTAWLFSRLPKTWPRSAVLVALLVATCYELRSFPHPMVEVWAGDRVPQAYHFMATLPTTDLVAGLPQSEGTRVFQGDAGRALHNYLMLYHKHRSLNGQSSYTLPVTDLVERMLRHLPDDAARRVLSSVGLRHLVVHAGDLDPSRRELVTELASQPAYYRRVFQQGTDSVFTLLPLDDPSLRLVDTPTLPNWAHLVSLAHATASLAAEGAPQAIDGNLGTYWSAGRWQARGQYFEVELAKSEPVVALEIDSQWHVSHVPLSFQLSVTRPGSPWQTVAEAPFVRVYKDQIYSPRKFVFRIVLPRPVLANRLRISILQPLPGHDFVVHEARVYAAER